MKEALLEIRSRLLRAAALRGSFEPRQLLREVLSEDEYGNRVLRARLMSSLRELSSVEKAEKSTKWILRATARHRELSDIDTFEPSMGETDIVQALSGDKGFAPEALDELIEVGTDEETLSQHLVALERAGKKAPGYDRLYALRSRLNLLRRNRRTDSQLSKKFIGRISEIEQINKWIDNPWMQPDLQTLHIEGHYGIGKSYLLERIIQITRERKDVILIRLDFDQPSLQTGQGGSIFEEVSRQIGNAIPRSAALFRELRLTHSEQVTRQINESSDLTPRRLIQAMVDAVSSAGKRLVILLDTLEVLHGQGATFVNSLMNDLDRFLDKGQLGLSVISAGRGPIFTANHPRLGQHIKLDQIEGALINQSLDEEGIAEEHRADILVRSKGNPLKLRLLIDQVKTEGRLSDAIEETNNLVATGIVNRAITSRLPQHLRGIANFGMVLRELNAENLAAIVAPALGLGDLRASVNAILEDLGLQSWLMDSDGQGRLTHKGDMRKDLLEPTYTKSPAETASINRAARDYYADRDPVLHLYHALQLTRANETAPTIDPSLAERFPEQLLLELPVEAQDLIRHARGQRSAPVEERTYTKADTEDLTTSPTETLVQVAPDAATARARIFQGHRSSGPDARAVNDLRNMLEQDQRREATHIIREGLTGAYDPTSEVGILILCHNWQSGHWSMARKLFNLLPRDTLHEMALQRPQLEGRILLEIYAEFAFKDLVERLSDDKFQHQMTDVVNSSSRIGMRTAALDFALLAAGAHFEGEHEVLGLIAPYLENGPRELTYERLRHASGLRSEFGLDYQDPNLPEIGERVGDYEIALAPLNPYFDQMRALVEELQASDSGRILRDLSNIAPGLYEAVDLFTPGLMGIDDALAQISPRPTDVLALIGAIGLTADWAEGYSFFHPIADLPTLARAARRWQQVVGGYWAFPTPPPEGWQSQSRWSDLTADRANELLIQADPKRAERAMQFWVDPTGESPKTAAKTLKRRIAPIFARLSREMGRDAILEKLTKSQAPVVFQPSLSTFAEMGYHPDYLNPKTTEN